MLQFSILKISMHVRRKSGFWFNNVFLPCWIITSSLLSSYGQPAGGGGRLEVSVTVLLTLTSFKFLVADKLPDVDYMTLMCVCARVRLCALVCACVRLCVCFSAVCDHFTCTRLL